jgi:2-polyprenyl-6-hydroxyphenyl methylase/3-demethylubiquinone-9 3-methyltransferase
MVESVDLLDPKSHFAFGKNWASYAKLVTEAQVEEAVVGLRRLAGGDLQGKRFLDIGCGSGLHSLAALRLGASEVVALDIDPESVATTRQLLQLHASGLRWSTLEASVFDLRADSLGRFDVVYSWGVLHHTGDMYRALRAAAALVAPQGQFIFALYRRTWLCWLWKHEKRWYAAASPAAQARARAVYVGLHRTMYALTNRGSFRSYLANYTKKKRGMDFYHDVHDWLGGWPYESISPLQTDRFMQQLGMRQMRAFVYAGTATGLLGSGCDEYVYSPGGR